MTQCATTIPYWCCVKRVKNYLLYNDILQVLATRRVPKISITEITVTTTTTTATTQTQISQTTIKSITMESSRKITKWSKYLCLQDFEINQKFANKILILVSPPFEKDLFNYQFNSDLNSPVHALRPTCQLCLPIYISLSMNVTSPQHKTILIRNSRKSQLNCHSHN